jgi:hypothetical protein
VTTDDDLDDEFSLGDGTMETAATVSCPCCGAFVEVGLDPAGGTSQEYVEDCEVCCQPWQVSVRYGADGRVEIWVAPLDE